MMCSVIQFTHFALRSDPNRTEERENGEHSEEKTYYLYL